MEKGNHSTAFRNPLELIDFANGDFAYEFKVEGDFNRFLSDHQVQILLTREYEHQLVQLRSENGGLMQRNMQIPHPTGIAIDEYNRLWLASTRNPNQIMVFKTIGDFLLPYKKVSISGNHYIHDLVFHQNELWSAVTGFDAKGKWINDQDKFELTQLKSEAKNHHQINSLAWSEKGVGYHTVSTLSHQKNPPGSLDFKVDQKGGIEDEFGEVICRNLTRPHSLRYHQSKLWVCNSGYGEMGFVENDEFHAVYKTDAWTRGLAFFGDYALIGTSKILERFKHYAPGIRGEGRCGLVLLNLKTYKVEAEINWEGGDQHFGIEIMGANDLGRLPNVADQTQMQQEPFYSLF